MYGLIHTATVYTPNGTTGEYDVTAKSSLPCRLCYIQNSPASLDHERANIGENRRLLWQETYTMPDDAQVEINSTRYNVRQGTYGAPTGPWGAVAYHRCEVTKVIT